MEITLEKIELVKDRTGVTYADAKKALEEADGSVVDAIIAIEETINSGEKRRGFGEKGEALFAKLKDLVKKGNVAKIQVKRDDEKIINIPVNVGIVGMCIAPLASVVAVVAAFGFKCIIEVVKTDGTIVDVSDVVTDTVKNATEAGSGKADFIKSKGKEYFDKAKDKAEEVKGKAEEVKEKAEGSDIIEKAKGTVSEVADKVKEKTEEVKGKVEENEFIEKAKEKVSEVADKIKKDEFDMSDLENEETAEEVEVEVEIEEEEK